MFDVNGLSELRIRPDGFDDGRLAHLREVVERKPEVSSDAFDVTYVHCALSSQHPAEVTVIESAEVASKGSKGDLPFLEELRQLLEERALG